MGRHKKVSKKDELDLDEDDEEEEDELDELMDEEKEESEYDAMEKENFNPSELPNEARKLTPEQRKQVLHFQKHGTVSKPEQKVSSNVKFVAVKQPERTVVAYANTGEVIAEDLPLWAAQMWADLKNEINELKQAIGSM